MMASFMESADVMFSTQTSLIGVTEGFTEDKCVNSLYSIIGRDETESDVHEDEESIFGASVEEKCLNDERELILLDANNLLMREKTRVFVMDMFSCEKISDAKNTV